MLLGVAANLRGCLGADFLDNVLLRAPRRMAKLGKSVHKSLLFFVCPRFPFVPHRLGAALASHTVGCRCATHLENRRVTMDAERNKLREEVARGKGSVYEQKRATMMHDIKCTRFCAQVRILEDGSARTSQQG